MLVASPLTWMMQCSRGRASHLVEENVNHVAVLKLQVLRSGVRVDAHAVKHEYQLVALEPLFGRKRLCLGGGEGITNVSTCPALQFVCEPVHSAHRCEIWALTSITLNIFIFFFILNSSSLWPPARNAHMVSGWARWSASSRKPRTSATAIIAYPFEA